MGSLLQSSVSKQSPPQLSHCEVSVGCLAPGSDAQLYLRDALYRSLLKDPEPSTSLLREVQFSNSQVVARFERGDGSLEQMLSSAARGSALLPLPFLWSVHVVHAAASALDVHHRLGISSAVELAPRDIITVQGQARLSAAILQPQAKLFPTSEPHRLSLAGTLAMCLGGADPNRRLAATRPLLPAALIQFIDGAPARACIDSTWQSECELLTLQQRRLQGPHFSTALPIRRSHGELRAHQLSLLPALLRVEGASAIDDFFEERCSDAQAELVEFRSAHALWRRERRLAASPSLAGSPTLERAKIAHEADSRARIAQARHEFERRDPHAALLFAIDAAQAAPEAPEAWLLLAQIRGTRCAGSRALCLAEAICASRGDEKVLALVRKQLGLGNQRELAAFFRVYGDQVLADWLDPRSCRQTIEQLRH